MFTDADIIHAYTVRQALEDGALIDPCARLEQDLVGQLGIRIPVYFTAGVWADLVKVPAVAPEQDEVTRAWDILGMLRRCMRLNRDHSAAAFVVFATHSRSRCPGAGIHRLLSDLGHDPEIGPYVSVMWPSER